MPTGYLTIRDGGNLIHDQHVTSVAEVRQAMMDHPPTSLRGSFVSVLMEIPQSVPFNIAKAVIIDSDQPVWGTEKRKPRYRQARQASRNYRSVKR